MTVPGALPGVARPPRRAVVSSRCCTAPRYCCWLGHKSITTTVDLYGHLVPEASGRARDALDRAFA
ncbi:MAG: hypothetical protein WBF20_08620 [Trebonia sp.]|uniref:hypothetical protein n=1 Tax=Trebonia sp. TaxID=2767075 RepID=UPI003BB20173